MGGSPFELASVSFWQVPIFLWLLSCFLAQDTSTSSSILPAAALELAISPRNPRSFIRKQCRKQDLSAEFAYCDWFVVATILQCHRHSTSTYWVVSHRGISCRMGYITWDAVGRLWGSPPELRWLKIILDTKHTNVFHVYCIIKADKIVILVLI